jgi:hypothetical protein
VPTWWPVEVDRPPVALGELLDAAEDGRFLALVRERGELQRDLPGHPEIVGVEEGEPGAARRLDAPVAGGTGPAVRLGDRAHGRAEAVGQRARPVSRPPSRPAW